MYQLGRAYAANRQAAEALAAYRKAADKGSSAAMVELGVMYGTGAGVAKDQAKAGELFERAAKAGNPRGVINLEALNGGASSNPAEARSMLAKAAEANSAEAQFQLGVMYAQGTGGPKDEVAARALFEKAAAQDHAGALEWLGAFAQSGRGGAQDTRAAKAYYERHGGKTIIIARFIPLIRTFVPVVAGAAKMEYRSFLLFNVFGGIGWIVSMIAIGYSLDPILRQFLGEDFQIAKHIDKVVLLVVFLSILPLLTKGYRHYRTTRAAKKVTSAEKK